MEQIRVLIVDDEPGIRKTLTQVMEDEGWYARAVSSGDECLKILKEEEFDVLILDVLLPQPGKNGIEVLKEVRIRYPNLPVIMISGHSTIKDAVEAIRIGAFDFIEKPLSLEKLIVIIKNAVEKKRLIEENVRLKESLKGDMLFIGESVLSRKVKELVREIADNDLPVLIIGASGSGKRIVARLIHDNSSRRDYNFSEVKLLSTPEEILEEEIFGKVVSGKVIPGKLDISDKGTLYLSEAHAIPPQVQRKISFYIESKKFERVGDTKNFSSDSRLIFSSTFSLIEIKEKGVLIEEILKKIGENIIRVPSLRERKEDIPLLVEHFLIHYTNEYGYEMKYFSDNALRYISQYDWPGNVRELKNFIERVVITVDREEIREEDVKKILQDYGTLSSIDLITRPYKSLESAVKNFEKEFIQYRLKKNNYDIEVTAKELKINPNELRDKIKLLGIKL